VIAERIYLSGGTILRDRHTGGTGIRQLKILADRMFRQEKACDQGSTHRQATSPRALLVGLLVRRVRWWHLASRSRIERANDILDRQWSNITNVHGMKTGCTIMSALLASVILIFGSSGLPLASQTLIPSGPTPPTGTTNYDSIKSRVSALGKGLELLDDLAISLEQDRRLVGLQDEIQRRMPERGGVLVIVRVGVEKDKGMGLPRHKRLVSVTVGPSGETEFEACQKFAKEELAIKQAPATPPMGPLTLRSNEEDFLAHEYDLRRVWVAAPFRPQVATQSTENVYQQTRRGVRNLLQAARGDYDKEKARLEIEWNAIEKQKRRLDERRGEQKNKPTSSKESDPATKADTFRTREQEKLRGWEETEKQAVTAERAAAVAANQAVTEIQRQIAVHNQWRCPAGYSYDECIVRHNEKRAFKLRRDQLEAELGLQQRLVSQHREAAEGRAARTASLLEVRRRQIEVSALKVAQRAEVQKAEDNADDRGRKAFRERLRLFSEDSGHLENLEAMIHEAERLLR